MASGRRRQAPRAAGAAALCAALVAAAATAAAAAPTATGPSRAAAPALDLAAARARAAAGRAVPRWRAPGPAFDARRARGKRVAVVPVSSALPYQQQLDAGLRAAARAAGIVLEERPNDGLPAQWAAAVDRAVDAKADLIALVGAPDPARLVPQLRRARAAGIPVVVAGPQGGDGAAGGATGATPSAATPSAATAGAALVTARLDTAGQQAQRLAAAAEIARSGGRTSILVVTSPDAPAAPALVAAFEAEVAALCGSACPVTVAAVPLAAWSSRIAPAVHAALAADPAIAWVHPLFDGMTTFAIEGIRRAGALGRVRIGTVDGSAAVLDLVAARAHRGTVAFDVGTSLAWHGWAAMDVILRVLLDEPVPRSYPLPWRLLDAGNVGAAGTPRLAARAIGDAHVDGYRRLWGLAG